jgi:WD40 repeat protein
MSSTSHAPSILQLRYIAGLKGDVKNNIEYVDETNVVYPAGYNIVVYNTEKKTQKFLPLAAPNASDAVSSGDISAMAMCNLNAATKHGGTGGGGPGLAGVGGAAGGIAGEGRLKSKILAVAERGEAGKASVAVFDLGSFKRRGKAALAISSAEVASSEFVCLCFSPDGKFLLTQGGAPDWTLVNWQWEKGKPLQIAKVSNQSGAVIHQCSYCPADPSVVCVTGNGILRFLHIEQNEFKVSAGERR